MEKTCNSSNIEEIFKKYLLAGKDNSLSYSDDLQRNSVRNYLSDLRAFVSWLEAKESLNSFSPESIALLTVSHVVSYRQYLIDENLPYATINRRLSTLRKFFTFCKNQGWITHNPAKEVENIKDGHAVLLRSDVTSLLDKYQKDLQKRRNTTEIEIVKEFLITN